MNRSFDDGAPSRGKNGRWRELVLLCAMAAMVGLTVVALLLATGVIG
jgi:hypothetical protein